MAALANRGGCIGRILKGMGVLFVVLVVVAFFDRKGEVHLPPDKARPSDPLAEVRPAAASYGVDAEVLAAIVGDVAGQLGGGDEPGVLADLAAIAAGMERPVPLPAATAAYVVFRRDEGLGRPGAVRAARLELLEAGLR